MFLRSGGWLPAVFGAAAAGLGLPSAGAGEIAELLQWPLDGTIQFVEGILTTVVQPIDPVRPIQPVQPIQPLTTSTVGAFGGFVDPDLLPPERRASCAIVRRVRRLADRAAPFALPLHGRRLPEQASSFGSPPPTRQSPPLRPMPSTQRQALPATSYACSSPPPFSHAALKLSASLRNHPTRTILCRAAHTRLRSAATPAAHFATS